jgi:hypothetical protein
MATAKESYRVHCHGGPFDGQILLVNLLGTELLMATRPKRGPFRRSLVSIVMNTYRYGLSVHSPETASPIVDVAAFYHCSHVYDPEKRRMVRVRSDGSMWPKKTLRANTRRT